MYNLNTSCGDAGRGISALSVRLCLFSVTLNRSARTHTLAISATTQNNVTQRGECKGVGEGQRGSEQSVLRSGQVDVALRVCAEPTQIVTIFD